MPRIAIPKTRQELRRRRHLRVRNVLSGTTERPRLVVFRSLKHITAQIVERGAEAVAPLLHMALDTSTLGQEEPLSLGPVHALRLLGELRALETAEPLLRKLPLPGDLPPTQAVYVWEQEVPQIVARLGAEVLPVVLDIADDEAASAEQRGAAIETLSYLSATTPDLRDEILAQLRRRFQDANNPTLRAYIVQALAELGAKDMYAPIMAAYRDGSVDRDIISAATARQVLLGSDKQRRIDCANHTLAERYEQLGPYSEEQRRAMAEMQRMMNES
jgi:ribosomal protein L18